MPFMVDADRLTKIARRKLHEIGIATGLPYDPGHLSETAALISFLARDLEVCSAFINSDSGLISFSEPIDVKQYRGDLGDEEIADEKWFDSIKKQYEEENDAILTLMDELRSCRSYIDSLTGALDSAKREIGSLKEILEEEGIRLDSQDKKKTEMNPLACSSISSFERPTPRLNSTALGELVKIREMKASKVEQFQIRIADGSVVREVGESIIDFLTVDIGLCDLLLAIDFNDRSSVIEGFRSISKLLAESKQPAHQMDYSLSLNSEESFLEFGFTQILNNVQMMMVSMKLEL